MSRVKQSALLQAAKPLVSRTCQWSAVGINGYAQKVRYLAHRKLGGEIQVPALCICHSLGDRDCNNSKNRTVLQQLGKGCGQEEAGTFPSSYQSVKTRSQHSS